MYRFKRNAVQPRYDLTKTRWQFGGTITNVETNTGWDATSPQIENTTANIDNGELLMNQPLSVLTLSNLNWVSFGIPFAIDQQKVASIIMKSLDMRK